MYQRTLINDLNRKFANLTHKFNDNFRGTQLHKWQVDYSYYIRDILTMPEYMTIKIVDNIEKMFDDIAKVDAKEVNDATRKMMRNPKIGR